MGIGCNIFNIMFYLFASALFCVVFFVLMWFALGAVLHLLFSLYALQSLFLVALYCKFLFTHGQDLTPFISLNILVSNDVIILADQWMLYELSGTQSACMS